MDKTTIYKKADINKGENPNFAFLVKEWYKWRILVLQGGARSGKTYSIIDFLLYIVQTYTGLTISIVRETLPSLKATILRDFKERAIFYGLWEENNFNKTDLEYKIGGNLIEFFSVDNEQKVRGRKRQLLWINEANEITKDKYLQLLIRLEGVVVMDYNPSMAYHYIYDDVLTRKDCAYIITTYRDNPYLPLPIIKEIERLQEVDKENWRIYGEGRRANIRAGVILDWWEKGRGSADLPFWYGVDFGFVNDPTAIVRISYNEKKQEIYLIEIAYQKELSNSDIARIIKQDIKERKHIIKQSEEGDIWVENGRVRDSIGMDVDINSSDLPEVESIRDLDIPIYCDIAEKKSIAELRMLGLSAYGSIKGKNSIVTQLSYLRYFKIFYTGENIETEVQRYSWKKRKDEAEFENTPIDAFNHLIDAARYGIYTHLQLMGINVGLPNKENKDAQDA